MSPAPLDQRVAAQRGLRSAAWFADLAPTVGRDPASGLELEVDVTGWPTRVTRLEVVTDELRGAAGLLSALRRAIGGAALAHLAAVAAVDDPSREQLARGQDLLEGRRAVVARPAFRAAPVVRPDGPVDPRSTRVDERWGRTATGRSRQGEVEVDLGWVGGLRTLRADPGFLRSTAPDLLRYALTEAFTAAQEGQRP